MVHKIRSGIYYLLKYLAQSSKPSDTYCVALYKMQLYFKFIIIIELIETIALNQLKAIETGMILSIMDIKKTFYYFFFIDLYLPR